MPLQVPAIAVFDLVSTLAFVELTEDAREIATLDVYSSAIDVLRGLRDEGVLIRVIDKVGEVPPDHVRSRLLETELGEFADSFMMVERSAELRDVFEAAAALVPREEALLLFVGADPVEREIAAGVRFKAAPHPALALGVLGGGGALRYLRIRVPPRRDWDESSAALREKAVVPIHLSGEPASLGVVIYAIGDTRTAAALDALGFWVDRLGAPDEPETTTAYLIRGDLQEQHGIFESAGNASPLLVNGPVASPVLASTHEGFLVALSSDFPLESLHFAEAHEGHARALSPSLNYLRGTSLVAARDTTLVNAALADPLSSSEIEILRRHLNPEFIKSVVERYVKMGSDEPKYPYGSRHFKHKGNKSAVALLVSDFASVSAGRLPAKHHCFTHNGAPAANVVAKLEATPGMQGAGVVLVCAHLDTFNIVGTPDSAAAPGADDDASGMAAVLAAASAFLELAPLRTRRREIRFVLFNCEEIGMTGSESYANGMAALKIPVSAMYQMDMIGYDHRGGGNIQAHVGFRGEGTPNGSAVRLRSTDQAELIEHLRQRITDLTERTQIYTRSEECGEGRSDHSKFHAAGYPGCWVSENLFACGRGCHELNPAYHTSNDTSVDGHYAAEIGRLVAAAAWIAATR
ncbi:MAG TPA: M20/M25/M40 family metallo-hydrolase [Longimicrobium sp.]|jgi:hypothetical protein